MAKDDYLNSDKMELRAYPDQLKACVEWDHKGQGNKKEELFRITPICSFLSWSLPQPLEEHEGSIEGDNDSFHFLVRWDLKLSWRLPDSIR